MEKAATWLEDHGGKIIVAAILAVGSYAISVRDLSLRNQSDIERLHRDVKELHDFKDQGDRFTVSDGARHERRIDALEECSSNVKERLSKLEAKIEDFIGRESIWCAGSVGE